MNIVKKFLFISFFFLFIFSSKSVLATTFDLYASTPGPYNRGQEVIFTVNIDTEGETLTNTAIGMTYDTRYLEFINTLPGQTFSTVTTDNLGNGKLVFYGQSSTGFSGAGKYVDVVFKLISQAPGSTELCVLWNPEVTSTPQPPTTTPAPPVSGEGKQVFTLSLIGVTMVGGSILTFLFNLQTRKSSWKLNLKTIKKQPNS